MWAKISVAEHSFLTTAEARSFVAAGYRSALTGAPDFAADSVRKQLAIYRDLGVLDANLAEVFKVIGEPPPLAEPAGTGRPATDRAAPATSSIRSRTSARASSPSTRT